MVSLTSSSEDEEGRVNDYYREIYYKEPVLERVTLLLRFEISSFITFNLI